MLKRSLFLAAFALCSLNSFALELSSPTLKNLQDISPEFVCAVHQGKNLSPELSWKDVPKNAQSLLLVMLDPDAPAPGGFVHWVAYFNNPAVTGLRQNQKPTEKDDFVFGKNDAHKNDFLGSCAPKGSGVHHYHYKLFALNFRLDKNAIKNNNAKDLLKQIQGHVVSEAEIVGLYSYN